MKKLHNNLTKILTLLTFATITNSCVINDAAPKPLPTPTIMNNITSFSISANEITNMKYVNIFRQKSNSEDFSEIEETINIGQVVPSNKEEVLNSFQFIDSYTSNDPNTFYRYKVRFFNGSIYSWSEPTTIFSGNGQGEATVTVDTPVLNYVWNDKDAQYYLSLGSDVRLPKDFTKLAVIFSNGTNDRPFIIRDQSDGLDETDQEKSIFKKSAAHIDLQKEFSSDFLDKDVEIVGLVGIQEFPEGNNKFINYYWTKPFILEKDQNHLFIYPTTGSFDDPDEQNKFMTSEGKPEGISPNAKIYVPSQKQPNNDFDISSSRQAVTNTKPIALDIK